MDFLSFRITSSYIVPFSCTYNGHQKSNCLLISSKLDVVKSLWNRLQSIVPDRIENGEKPCISKDFLVLCFTSRCHIGATPKREVVSPSLAGGAKHRDFTVNHGVFITIGPIIKLLSLVHLAAPALTGCQMDSNTF